MQMKEGKAERVEEKRERREKAERSRGRQEEAVKSRGRHYPKIVDRRCRFFSLLETWKAMEARDIEYSCNGGKRIQAAFSNVKF